MKKSTGLFVLFLIVGLPLVIYFFLKISATHHFDSLEIVGAKHAVTNPDGSIDSVYHNIYDFYKEPKFFTQTGELLHPDSLRGYIIVANVFFARCPGICPKLSSSMERIQEHYGEVPDVKFLSISVDPERDTVEVLREYADRFNAVDNKWYFLTGNKKELYEFADKAFFFRAFEGPGGELGFIHDEKIMLIDWKGRIRKGEQFYNGTKPEDVELLVKEIKVLQIEKNGGKR